MSAKHGRVGLSESERRHEETARRCGLLLHWAKGEEGSENGPAGPVRERGRPGWATGSKGRVGSRKRATRC